jgi:hypothetical protein
MKDAAKLLGDAHDKGLTFGVSVSGPIAEDTARALHAVMTSPQSRVTSLDYASVKPLPDTQATHDLRDAIANCHTLQCVSGFPGILDLLERGIPEIALKAITAGLNEEQLTKVLGFGGVTKLSLKSDVIQAHQSLAKAVSDANAKLPGNKCVREVELATYSSRREIDPNAADVVCRLLDARHLEALRLPNPHWLTGASVHMASLTERHSLESLTFAEEAGRLGAWEVDEETNSELAALDRAMERNRFHRNYCMTRGAATALTGAMTQSLFENSPVQHLHMHAGAPVDELAKHLASNFGSTRTGQAITSVNTKTRNAAREKRFDSEDHYRGDKMSAEIGDVLTAAKEGDAGKLAAKVAQLGTSTVLAYAEELRRSDPNAARELVLARLRLDLGTPEAGKTYLGLRQGLMSGSSSVAYADVEARIPDLEDQFQIGH